LTPHLTARPRWWQWPTILSLDAPVVCLLWQALIARVVAADLRWPHVYVLGTSVWLAYAADRWIEGFRLDRRTVRTQRHFFYQRRRWTVAAVWACVCATDVGVAVGHLSRSDLIHGLALLVPVLAYLLSHQLVHRDRRWRAPKELVTAVLLTAGVLLFAWPAANAVQLIYPAATFALVGFTNCALISAWERDVDRAHGQTSLARDSARTVRLIRRLPWLIAAAGLLVIPILANTVRPVVVAGLASALLLGVVDRAERSAGWALARVLADLALVTPAIPLILSRL
jgi:hypothetical protein